MDSTGVWLVDTQRFEVQARVGVGPGRWDGIEFGFDGNILVSSLASGEILEYRAFWDIQEIRDLERPDKVDPHARPTPRVLASGLELPGNFAWCFEDKFVLVPEIAVGRVHRIPLSD